MRISGKFEKEVLVTTKQLPTKPSIHQLRKQAKELIRAFRTGNAEARERIASQVSRVADAIRAGNPTASLTFAQLTLAREYGFESWPKLKVFVDSTAMTFEEKLKLFVAAATANRLYVAEMLLKGEPALATHDLSTACIVGDHALVEKLIQRDPSLVSRGTGLNGWEPLLYVCFSFFHRRGAEAAAGLLRTAELLLKAGANPNAFYAHPTHAQFQIPALYGPSGATNFPELTELLLGAGANPDERESLYHSTEFRDGRCMRLLLKAGANAKKWGALHHMLDVEDLEGVKALLAAGADPNLAYEGLGTALHHAAVRGRSGAVIECLLSAGASASAENPQGFTPYEMALRYGNQEAIAALRGKSPVRSLSPAAQLIAACAAGDEKKAKSLLGATLDASDQRMIAEFAALGKSRAVLLMLDLGFDINQRGEWGGTVIQQAAWHGHLELVEALIARGADLELLNDHKGTCLGATIFATEYRQIPEAATGPHIAIAEALLEAGAKLLPHMPNMGNEAMSDFLATYSSS